MKKKKSSTIPTKNYIIAITVSLFAIFLTYYIFCWHDVYKEKKYSESYLIKTKTISLEVNDLNEIKSTFVEAPSEYFIYIGYRNDEEENKLEKNLKKIIDKYNLNDNFYYIDVTELKKENNYIEKLNDVLDLKENKIKSVPTIIYIKDNKVLKDAIITREDGNMVNAGDFEKLLEMYEIKK